MSVLAPTVPPPPSPHPNHFSGQKYKNTDPKIQKSTLRIVRVSVIVLRGAPLTGRPDTLLIITPLCTEVLP